MPAIRSYTSTNRRIDWLKDFWRLTSGTVRQKRAVAAHVASVIAQVRAAEDLTLSSTGLALRSLNMLEIGVGQLPRQMGVFAAHNSVTGIDLDVIPRGLDPAGYLSMLRTNGVKRVLKTIARKAIGFDRAFQRELARQLGLPRLPPLRVEQMDATRMAFPDSSFDFVYSFDVFEHFPEPAPVFDECARVLRPGGVCFTSLHPVTAEDGFHDLRIINDRRGEIPPWAHLRPDHVQTVSASAFLNSIRVDDWRRIIESSHPGSTVLLSRRPDHDRLASQLQSLRARGELESFSDEELLCHRLIAIWKKPFPSLSRHAPGEPPAPTA